MKMKRFVFGLIILQTISNLRVNARSGTAEWSVIHAENSRTVSFSDQDTDWFLVVSYNVHLPMAQKRLSVLKDSIYGDLMPSNGSMNLIEKIGSLATAPVVSLDIDGGESYAMPNDDYLAVSASGKIVSTQNNLISIYDETGNLVARKSLRTFAGASALVKPYDPRVIYDEAMDRFIVVYLSGNTYETSKVQVAFSGSNDPAGEWYHYTFSGNPFNDSTWHDYPSVALCGPHLFITFNTFRNNSVSNSGFKQSLIWQLEKQKGYDHVPSDELTAGILQHINHDGLPLFAVHPVIGSPDTSMYFLTNNALSPEPDSNFLLLSLKTKAPLAQPQMQELSSSLWYQLPPDAFQKNTDRKLNTNDARIQDSFYSNGSISFVLNSARKISDNLISAVYFGRMFPGTSDQVAGEFLPDSLETAFASVAPASNEGFVFCYSYSSPECFPGIAIAYRDNQGNYSRPVNVTEGTDWTSFWGDYNKICRHPSLQNIYWLSACYGLDDGSAANGELATRIARIIIPIASGENPAPTARDKIILYPNPSRNNRMTATFSLKQSQLLKISIYDMSGRPVDNIVEDQMPQGTHRISFSTESLPRGMYILLIKGTHEVLFNEKFSVE